MARITFLCSGGGGNLRLLHRLCQWRVLPADVACVIADRECPAVHWSRLAGVECHVVPYSKSEPGELAHRIALSRPDIVVATIHKILDEDLVAAHSHRLVNLHYSLLPAFGGLIGMEPVRRARAQGCRLIGATAHRVTNDLDAGPVLAQACFADDPAIAEVDAFDRVFRCGGWALAAAVEELLGAGRSGPGRAFDAGGSQLFVCPAPGEAVAHALADDALWASIR